MKKLIYAPLFLMVIAGTFQSCSGEKKEETTKETTDSTVVKDEPKASFADMCKDENAMIVTIKDYKYQMKGKYAFETPNFEVKQSSWTITSDSTAELKMSNYAATDLVGDRKDEQVDILVSFRAKGGKKIEIGTYTNQSYDAPYNCTTTMMTSKGLVYFNWLMGMPESGTVTLNYIDNESVCGSFTLAAEKPESEMIGTVRLNGTFKVGK